MAIEYPAKETFVDGDILSAAEENKISSVVNAAFILQLMGALQKGKIMAVTQKTLFRGAATTTVTTTLYTVPTATSTVVSNIVVTNTAAAAGTFTLALGTSGSTVNIFTTVSIGANSTTLIDLKQPLTAAQIITGGASATTINFHIAGVEIA